MLGRPGSEGLALGKYRELCSSGPPSAASGSQSSNKLNSLRRNSLCAPADRVGLQSIIRDRNSPQKHVWRARIIVLTADGEGTTAVMRAVGKGKTVVWRWQERFMHEGVEGLTRDKTRPSRIPPLPPETVDRVVALTNQAPPDEASHWTASAMAKVVGISPSAVRRIWKRHGLQPHRVRAFKLSNDPQFAEKLKDVVGLYVDPPADAVVSASTRRAKSRRLTAPSPDCR